jgi:hypothetical protein
LKDGSSTLEKDVKKLDLVKYDLEFDVDPLFKTMTAKFSETGARGLILESLPLDSNLDVLLEADQMLFALQIEKEKQKKKLNDSAIKRKNKESETEIFQILESKNILKFYFFHLENLKQINKYIIIIFFNLYIRNAAFELLST